MIDWADKTAADIAAAVKTREVSARKVVELALGRIDQRNTSLNAFTDVTATRALARADAVDAIIASGGDPGPLAGVPFAVKNLFDVADVVTLAGSKINRAHASAIKDAVLIERLEQSGAVLVGALNMGEYAYDFTGENAHVGPSRNPHDPQHMTGGSSGGSGGAVAGGMVPLSLGSDTNGSIRVPSSFCGLFGLKPTYGRLPRSGSFPFVASLDHLGPMARSTADLALAFDAMQGPDAGDAACADVPALTLSSSLGQDVTGLRIAIAGGHFRGDAHEEAHQAVDVVAEALGTRAMMDVPGAAEARAAAYLITMAEGAALHLDRLKTCHADFDADVRDRLIAGAMIPGAWVSKAQKYRRDFRQQVLTLFEIVDVLLAPSTPCVAPMIGQKILQLGDQELPLRPNVGVFTQPVSFIGLPVVSVPVWLAGKRLPMGVQIICAPWREDVCIRVSHWLERQGVVRAPVAAFKENKS
jgi:1-carboxybiuret hydrolase